MSTHLHRDAQIRESAPNAPRGPHDDEPTVLLPTAYAVAAARCSRAPDLAGYEVDPAGQPGGRS